MSFELDQRILDATGHTKDWWIERFEVAIQTWSTPFKTGQPGQTFRGPWVAYIMSLILQESRQTQHDGNIEMAIVISEIFRAWSIWVLQKKANDPGYPDEDREYMAELAGTLEHLP